MRRSFTQCLVAGGWGPLGRGARGGRAIREWCCLVDFRCHVWRNGSIEPLDQTPQLTCHSISVELLPCWFPTEVCLWWDEKGTRDEPADRVIFDDPSRFKTGAAPATVGGKLASLMPLSLPFRGDGKAEAECLNRKPGDLPAHVAHSQRGARSEADHP